MAVSRIMYWKDTGTKFGLRLTNRILDNSWSFSGHRFFPINKIRVSVSPCPKLLDSHSHLVWVCRQLWQVKLSVDAPAYPWLRWLFPWGRGLREGHAQVSLVLWVSVFDAGLFVCIMTGYMFPGTCTKKTLPCSPVGTTRKPSFKAN